MRLSLQGYFDLGASFGLGDTSQVANLVINDPCGGAELLDLKGTEIEQLWRRGARNKVNDPELHFGFQRTSSTLEESEEEFVRFKRELADCIEKQRSELFYLSIHPVGTVFVRLDLASGVPAKFVQGILQCYEWAAYEPEMSECLWREARKAVERTHALDEDHLWKISARRPVSMKTDEEKEGKRLKADWFTLLPSFMCIALCVDQDDDAEAIKRTLRDYKKIAEPIEFEYLGKLHFGWYSSLLEPSKLPAPAKTPEQALERMGRMVECIRIAIVFLGTCEALRNLFSNHGLLQMGGSVPMVRTDGSDDKPLEALNWRNLNHLRSLATAVTGRLNYYFVSAADEDQQFFKLWEQYAQIESRKRWILEQCELLYSVEVANAEEARKKREMKLNTTIFAFTALTVVSVVADAHHFFYLSFPEWANHLLIVAGAAGGLFMLLWLVWRFKIDRE